MYIFLMLHAKKVYKHARSPRSIILLHEKHKQDVVCLDYLCIFPKICMFFMCMYYHINEASPDLLYGLINLHSNYSRL